MNARYTHLFALSLTLPLVSCRFVGGKPDFSVMGDAFSPVQADTVYVESKPRGSVAVASSLPRASTAIPAAMPAPAATAPLARNGLYTVCPGDTLSRIARTHGITLSDLMAANGLNHQTAVIRPGQQLRIPQAGTAPRAALAARPATPPPAPRAQAPVAPAPKAASPGQYQVKAGDTLYRIARQNGITLNELLQANKLNEATADSVRAGTILTIPARH